MLNVKRTYHSNRGLYWLLMLTLTIGSISVSANESRADWTIWSIETSSNTSRHCWQNDGYYYHQRDSNQISKELVIAVSNDSEHPKIMTQTDNCPKPLKESLEGDIFDKGRITSEKSLALLEPLLNGAHELRSSEQGRLFHLLAIHSGEQAFERLKMVYSDERYKHQKESVSLFIAQYRGLDGLNFLTDALDGSTELKERKALIFALSQSNEYKKARSVILQEMDKYATEELLNHCVFALSQLRDGYGLEELVTLIKSHPNAKVRKQAFFWLAHANEDKAMPLLDELLSDA